MENTLTEEIEVILYNEGADLVGIGSMSGVKQCSYPIGISVAVHVPFHIVKDLKQAPTIEYYNAYEELNSKLNHIVSTGEDFLIKKGYRAYAQTTNRVSIGADRKTLIPHKTVATHGGLGWIGKNCLLVTNKYGPAVRLSSAPLKCNDAVTESRCGSCMLCSKACPAGAIRGTLWYPGMSREEIVDVELCYNTQLKIMRENVGLEADLCGKCFAVCAYTQKNLRDS